MNLMPRKIIEDPPEDYIYVKDFRKYQYNMLYNFLKLCIDYLNQNNANIFIKDILIKEKPTYFGLFNHELLLIEVLVDIPTDDDKEEDDDDKNKSKKKVKPFIKLFIPKLIDGTFFILNGNYYYPTMYILDKPISIKKKSILINGTFNSITFNIDRKYVTFTGLNLKLSSILDLFLPEDDQYCCELYDEFVRKNNISSVVHREDINHTIQYLSGMFNCKANIESIKKYFDDLILDVYTKNIFAMCYNIDINEISVQKIVQKAIELNIDDKRPSFIDLRNKRLIFMELLLQPLFKKVAVAAIEIKKGFKRNIIKMNPLDIIKHFNTNLKGDFIYQEKNGYSAIGKMKTRFINPATTNVPTIVANLHETHYGRICPISVGNKDVGQTISLLPTVLVDLIGQFVENNRDNRGNA